jgi:hypothetical protein
MRHFRWKPLTGRTVTSNLSVSTTEAQRAYYKLTLSDKVREGGGNPCLSGSEKDLFVGIRVLAPVTHLTVKGNFVHAKGQSSQVGLKVRRD